MLTGLRIKNFKCLRDTKRMDIRPLTFLVGPNSSGKSSVLKMLLMLRQTVDSTDIGNPLAPNDGWVNLGTYPEFIYKGTVTSRLEVELEFTAPKSVTKTLKTPSKKRFNLRLRAVFGYSRRTKTIELIEREISTGKHIEQIIKDTKQKKYTAILKYPESGKQKEWRRDNVEIRKFYDFFIAPKRGESRKALTESILSIPYNIFYSFPRIVEKELRSVFYLGPLREEPQRIYTATGGVPQDVGKKGERAFGILWHCHTHRRKEKRKIENNVRFWVKELGIGKDLRLVPIGKGYFFGVKVTDAESDYATNLADVGFGASQVLPIIIESFYLPSDSLVLIEQPEIHLHPRAQARLGDLFIGAVKEKDRNFIIETHSEHILDRVRLAIAEERINKDDVAIYYFDPTPKGTNVEKIGLNKFGQYKNFPEGFFEEDVDEVFAHLEAIRKRKEKKRKEKK